MFDSKEINNMLKALAKKLLKKTGLQIVRIPKQHKSPSSERRAFTAGRKNKFASMIAGDPLNANMHLKYAIFASEQGRHYLAYAELKTAQCLGADEEEVEKYITAFRRALPDPKYMNHNQYFRFKTLSSEIITHRQKIGLSILDIGGGEGELASFLPDDATYCLVEPTVNGILGTNLPFPDRSFDCVVSCHVLEHIPVKERWIFLDQLLSKSKRGVILLNPFHVEHTCVDERLRLVLEITDAQWAKEHLECTLPKVDDIKAYAADRELQFRVKPNGTVATSMAFVFVDYFAAQSGHQDDWKKMNVFFNEKYTDILDSEKYPNAYLIYLGWPETKTIKGAGLDS